MTETESLRRIFASLSTYGLGLVITLYVHGLRDAKTSPEQREHYASRLPIARAELATRKDRP